MTDTERIAEIRHLNEDGLYGPGRIRADIDLLLAEVERLRRWKAEGTEVMLGLQDVGKALGIPLGTSITGTVAAAAATDLRERATDAGRERDHLQERLDHILAGESAKGVALVASARRVRELTVERNGLQARLDEMTTVYRFRFSDGRYNDEEYGSRESLIVDYGEPSEREGIETCERTPWRDVPTQNGKTGS